jgi:hypothetical protein
LHRRDALGAVPRAFGVSLGPEADSLGLAVARHQQRQAGCAQHRQAAALEAGCGARELQIVVRDVEHAHLGGLIEVERSIESEPFGDLDQIAPQQAFGGELGEHGVAAEAERLLERPTDDGALAGARRREMNAFDAALAAADADAAERADVCPFEQRDRRHDLEQTGGGRDGAGVRMLRPSRALELLPGEHASRRNVQRHDASEHGASIRQQPSGGRLQGRVEALERRCRRRRPGAQRDRDAAEPSSQPPVPS